MTLLTSCVNQLANELQAACDALVAHDGQLANLKLMRAQTALQVLRHRWTEYLVVTSKCRCAVLPEAAQPPGLIDRFTEVVDRATSRATTKA